MYDLNKSDFTYSSRLVQTSQCFSSSLPESYNFGDLADIHGKNGQ